MKTVLIAGASGYCGSHLVSEFSRRGWKVRALVRNEEQADRFKALASRVIMAEVTKPETLNTDMEGVDTVISAVGITTQKEGFSYLDVDYQGNLNLLREAEKAGVKHFAYVASYRGAEFRHLCMVDAKERFVDALRASHIRHTIIRPNGFFIDLYAVLGLVSRGPYPLIDGGESRVNYISGADLAMFIARAVENKQKVAEAGGPELLSQREVAELAFEVLGRQPEYIHFTTAEIDAAIRVVRTFSEESTYGLLEFMFESMRSQMAAPFFGKDRVKQFLSEAAVQFQHTEAE